MKRRIVRPHGSILLKGKERGCAYEESAIRPEIIPEKTRSICGRPRALTAAQVAEVLAWHDSRVTLKAFAAKFGVNESTLTYVIRTRGLHYKQPPPEERVANVLASRMRRRKMEAANLM